MRQTLDLKSEILDKFEKLQQNIREKSKEIKYLKDRKWCFNIEIIAFPKEEIPGYILSYIGNTLKYFQKIFQSKNKILEERRTTDEVTIADELEENFSQPSEKSKHFNGIP